MDREKPAKPIPFSAVKVPCDSSSGSDSTGLFASSWKYYHDLLLCQGAWGAHGGMQESQSRAI